MAQKNTGGKKKRTNPSPKIKQTQQDSFLGPEIRIIILFGISLFLLLSNLKKCGVIGTFFRNLQLGLFGALGFLFPFILFFTGLYSISNRDNDNALRKIPVVVLALVSACSLVHLFIGKSLNEVSSGVLSFFEEKAAGGLVGGGIACACRSVVGLVGAFIILAISFVISIICITEKSFLSAIRDGGSKAYVRAKDDIEKRKVHDEPVNPIPERRPGYSLDGVNIAATNLASPEEQLLRAKKNLSKNLAKMGKNIFDDPSDPPKSSAEGKYEEYPDPDTVFEEDKADEIPINGMYSDDNPEKEHKDEAESDKNEDTTDEIAKSGKEKSGISDDDVFTLNDDSDNGSDDSQVQPWQPESQPYDPDGDYAEIFEKARIILSSKKNLSDSDDDIRDGDYPSVKISGKNTYSHKDVPIHESSELSQNRVPSSQSFSENIREAIQDTGVINTGLETKPLNSFESDDDFEDIPNIDDENPDSYKGTDNSERIVTTASGKVIRSETSTDSVHDRMLESRKNTPVGNIKEKIENMSEERIPYVIPPYRLLEKGGRTAKTVSDKEYRDTALKLQQTLKNFGVAVTVTNISCGPVVTRYELHPEQGVKVSRIVSLEDDIKLSLAASDIRIEAPIPGKSAVGIEVPNVERNTVFLRDLLESDEFRNNRFKLAFAVGKDIAGQNVVTDISKMPHLLIAGATGSGKSVCINTMIMSIIYKYSPEDVSLIMIDPKVVELSVYNGIPHLLIPVVTDPKKAAGALNWAVAEMTDRYQKFAASNVRDLRGYNERIEQAKTSGTVTEEELPKKLPQIVIIIDELADLMMVAQSEVEDAICRLAQLARAAGLHLVIATQRPSVNVITGLIKANIPSRIAFSVSSSVDSRTILDGGGAEKLLGKGDMLFAPQGAPKPIRVQGAFLSDEEVQNVVDYLVNCGYKPSYDKSAQSTIEANAASVTGVSKSESDTDELFEQAGYFIIERNKASIGNLQRMFKIGFNRAARIMDQLCESGVVGNEQGTKPREILMTAEEFTSLMQSKR